MVKYNYLYDQEYYRTEFEAEHMVEKKLSYESYENAYVVPLLDSASGVYTKNKQYIDSSGLHNGWGHPLRASEVVSSAYIDETVVYLGVFYSCWGHVLTDVIRRFWIFKENRYLEDFSGYKLVFADIDGHGLSESASKLLEILGLDQTKLIMPNEIIQCRKIIIPDDCFFSDVNGGRRYFTPEYRGLIQTVRLFQQEHFTLDNTYEKTYFSYAECAKKNKGNVGEEKLEKFFKAQGYNIVYPEKHTFEEQLNILANCRFFASTVGSCSHNIIFLPEQSKVAMIPRAFYLPAYQIALDQVIDLNIEYIDSSLSMLAYRKSPWSGPFYYYVSENLIKYFGVDVLCGSKYYKKEMKDFKRYMRTGRAFDDLEGRYMPEYYIRQFAYCMQKLSDAHPYRRYMWKILLWGPGKIKKVMKDLWLKYFKFCG